MVENLRTEKSFIISKTMAESMSLNEESCREHVEQEMDEVWSPVKDKRLKSIGGEMEFHR